MCQKPHMLYKWSNGLWMPWRRFGSADLPRIHALCQRDPDYTYFAW